MWKEVRMLDLLGSGQPQAPPKRGIVGFITAGILGVAGLLAWAYAGFPLWAFFRRLALAPSALIARRSIRQVF